MNVRDRLLKQIIDHISNQVVNQASWMCINWEDYTEAEELKQMIHLNEMLNESKCHPCLVGKAILDETNLFDLVERIGVVNLEVDEDKTCDMISNYVANHSDDLTELRKILILPS